MDNLKKRIDGLFENSSTRENDIYFYEKALNEYESNNRIKGIYAKALSLAQGEESKVKSKYLDLRVEILKDEFKQLKKDLNDIENSDIKDERILKKLQSQKEKNQVIVEQEKYFSRFSWGTFIFSFLYGLRYRVWSTFLIFIPYVGILIILFSISFSSRKKAWMSTSQDFETFQKENDNWDYWGQFVFVVSVILVVAAALFLY